MRRVFVCPIVLISSFVSSCYSCAYFVDSSCTNRPEWSDGLTDALTMAKRASERLERSQDTDFAAVFKRIFKVEKTSTATFQNPFFSQSDPKHDLTPYDRVHGEMNPSTPYFPLTSGRHIDRYRHKLADYFG